MSEDSTIRINDKMNDIDVMAVMEKERTVITECILLLLLMF